jgi:transposase
MARPRKEIDGAEVVRLRREGLSWRQIASRTGLGRGTVVRACQAVADSPGVSQNPFGAVVQADRSPETSAERLARLKGWLAWRRRVAETPAERLARLRSWWLRTHSGVVR